MHRWAFIQPSAGKKREIYMQSVCQRPVTCESGALSQLNRNTQGSWSSCLSKKISFSFFMMFCINSLILNDLLFPHHIFLKVNFWKKDYVFSQGLMIGFALPTQTTGMKSPNKKGPTSFSWRYPFWNINVLFPPGQHLYLLFLIQPACYCICFYSQNCRQQRCSWGPGVSCFLFHFSLV